MAFIYDLTDTWNAGGTTFNAIKMNVTDTASAAASKLITVQVGGAEKFSVRKDGLTYVAGSLGVGTSSPSAKLEVSGSVRFVDSSAAGPDLLFGNIGGSTAINNVANARNYYGAFEHIFTNFDNTTERMRITSAGLVGVGTSSPSQRLDATVSSGTEGVGLAITNSLAGGYGSGVNFYSFRTDGTTKLIAGAVRMVGAANWADAANTSSHMTFHTVNANTLAERARIDASGNLLVGTTTAGSRLTVNGGALASASSSGAMVAGSLAAGRLTSGGAASSVQAIHTFFDDQSYEISAGSTSGYVSGIVVGARSYTGAGGDAVSLWTRSAERMRITSAGRVGIGTSSPALPLVVSNNGASGIEFDTAGGLGSGPYIQAYDRVGAAYKHLTYYAAQHTWYSGATRAFDIDSSGNLLVGTTSNASLARVRVENSGNDGVFSQQNAAGGYCYKTNAANNSGTYYHMEFQEAGTPRGTITSNGSSVSYNTSSDARLKTNIAPADDAAALIDAIQVRKFDWKADGSHQRYGMVAQELLEVAPEAVSGEPEGEEMMGVDYSKLVPMLIKEVQSLRARVAQLEGN